MAASFTDCPGFNRNVTFAPELDKVWQTGNGSEDVGVTSQPLAWYPYQLYFLVGVACTLMICLHSAQQRRGSLAAAATHRLPPGSLGWPLIGETLAFVKDGREYFRSRFEAYGPIFMSHVLGRPTVVVVGPSALRRVLTAPDSVLGPACPPGFARLFGDHALCTTTGTCHRRLKRAVASAFDADGMARVAAAAQRVVGREVSDWTVEGRSAVYCLQRCRRIALQIVCEPLLGLTIDDSELDQLVQLFADFSDAAFALPVNLPGFAFRRGLMARQKLTAMIRELKQRRHGERPLRTDDEVVDADAEDDLTLELMFGGQETTASAMCTAVVHLAEHPDVLVGVRAELDAVVGKLDAGQSTSYGVLRTLTYTSDVVREVLRIQPPIAGGFRQTLDTFRVMSYEIPAGWCVLYSITDTHEQNFTDVDQFRPSRWTTTSFFDGAQSATCTEPSFTSVTAAADSRYSYVPFGGGSRRYCVGRQLACLSLLVFVVELARSAERWDLINGRPHINTAPIPIPINDLPVLFHRRL